MKTRASIQKAINEECIAAMDNFVDSNEIIRLVYVRRLRTCKAVVYENDFCYALKSYNTMVAIIDKATDTLYDFSRYVYGYTATTCQHIRKFEKDYGTEKWGCKRVVTYRPI